MVKDLKLKGNELIVFAIIYGFTQAENQSYTGSLQYLADWTNCTKQGVLNNLRSLLSKGLIVKKDTFLNGVKFVEYRSNYFNRVLKNFEYPIKNFLPNNIENKKDNKIVLYNDEFEKLWKIYPKKQGKTKAHYSFIKARQKGTTFEEIESGLKRYIAYVDKSKIKSQYIKQGSTWFNQQCWQDEYEEHVMYKQQPESSFDIDELDIIR